MSGKTLIYIPSDEIVDFITKNPIDWGDRDAAKRGGIGDQAGVTPTPAVEEFIDLLLTKRSLFTQDEYIQHCRGKWIDWLNTKTGDQRLGVRAKLLRNFYPSMIDSLHVWAMLCESGMFDRCVLNSTEDAIGKSDISVYSKDRVYRIALVGPTRNAIDDRQYKIKHRNGDKVDDFIEIVIPKEYPRDPGNKRWLRKSDVMAALLKTSVAYGAS